jgi:IclR family mhp operon transcriptional activator
MTIRSQAAKHGTVRSLERGLRLLELVNDEGGIRPSDAGRLLQLPRPTAHRLLETLEELGYIRRTPTDNRFLVTIKARRLSGGYDTDVQMSEAVGPILARLLKDIVWPVNIATHRGGMMIVRETTHERSPLSIDKAMLGREVPMLRTASGRAYLAFCSEKERGEIIEYLKMRDDPEDESYLYPRALEKMIAVCQRNGYGSRLGEAFVPKTSSIALPILVDGQARGCIAVVWLTQSMSASRAIKEFLPPLRNAAAAVAKQVAGNQWFMPESARTTRKKKGE